MTLAHKGLEFETIPWRFTDKDVIAFSGQGRVPVLVDNGKEVHDSWQIALYLDETYPEKPVMKSTAVRAAVTFVREWVNNALQPAILPLILNDIFDCIDEKDRGYFRESREKRFGKPLEHICPDKAKQIEVLDKILTPLASTLTETNYLGGDEPNYADYVVFGRLQWARVVMREPVVPTAGDGPIAEWFTRLLNIHDGFAGRAPTVLGA